VLVVPFDSDSDVSYSINVDPDNPGKPYPFWEDIEEISIHEV